MTDDDRMPPPLIRAALSTGLVPTPYLWGDPASTPRRQWLYKPSYIRQFVSALFATTGAGKSSLVLVEAMAMACGKALLGVTPEQQLKVWYWNGEDPPDTGARGSETLSFEAGGRRWLVVHR
jgi:AAA domain